MIAGGGRGQRARRRTQSHEGEGYEGAADRATAVVICALVSPGGLQSCDAEQYDGRANQGQLEASRAVRRGSSNQRAEGCRSSANRVSSQHQHELCRTGPTVAVVPSSPIEATDGWGRPVATRLTSITVGPRAAGTQDASRRAIEDVQQASDDQRHATDRIPPCSLHLPEDGRSSTQAAGGLGEL